MGQPWSHSMHNPVASILQGTAYRRRCLKFTLTRTHFTLFTITACFGSKTCFLRWFHNRSVSFFGQKTQEHVKTIKKRCLEAKNNIFRKNAFKKNMFYRRVSLHVPTVGALSDFSDPKLNFWGNFQMILHGFAWRNLKSKVLRPKNLKIRPNTQKHNQKPKNLTF